MTLEHSQYMRIEPAIGGTSSQETIPIEFQFDRLSTDEASYDFQQRINIRYPVDKSPPIITPLGPEADTKTINFALRFYRDEFYFSESNRELAIRSLRRLRDWAKKGWRVSVIVSGDLDFDGSGNNYYYIRRIQTNLSDIKNGDYYTITGNITFVKDENYGS